MVWQDWPVLPSLAVVRQLLRSRQAVMNLLYRTVNNTSVRKYWKILFYPPNTDTGTFYRISTDIDTDAQYPKFNTVILAFPVFYSISILCFKPLIESCYLRLLTL